MTEEAEDPMTPEERAEVEKMLAVVAKGMRDAAVASLGSRERVTIDMRKLLLSYIRHVTAANAREGCMTDEIVGADGVYIGPDDLTLGERLALSYLALEAKTESP